MRIKLISICLFLGLGLVGCNIDDEGPAVGSNNTSANNAECDESTMDCDVDCAGTPGGDAYEDACGVCDDDPDNDCEVDCAGTPGGDAYEDPCGVCDADPDNDCEVDCAGTPGGDAYEDECGVCDSEPQNDCQPDCAGTFGGDAYEDACGVCDADPDNDCVEDCEGVPNGPATLDFCGRCTGGTTGRLPCTVIDLPVVADATVDGDNASTNFGSEATVNAESTTSYGYFKYDLSNIADDDVVYNVELGFTAIDAEARDGDGTTYVETVPDNWDETAITWDMQPELADGELTGSFDATDALNGVQRFAFSSNQLAGHVAQEAAGNDLASVRLRAPGYKVRFASREGSADNVPTMKVGVVKAREEILEPVAGATIDIEGSEHISSTVYNVDPPRFSGERAMILRFDLSSLPANAQIERVFVSAMASEGFAYGGDGNVYTLLIEDDTWDESSVTGADFGFESLSRRKSENLGYWWLWYDSRASDKLGVNGSLKLVPVVQQEFENDQTISLYFGSTGYRTQYYYRSARDATKRPKMRILFTLPGQ